MPDMQRSRVIPDNSATAAPSAVVGCAPISATDAIQLSEQTRDWHFEFTQLKRGSFNADGCVLELDGVSVARVAMSQTLLHRGYAPPNMVGVFVPGVGSGAVFANGQLVEPGQCVTLSEGASLEAVTHGRYLDVAFGFDMNACRRQLDALNGGSMGLALGTAIAAPGPSWNTDMLGRVEWLLASAVENPNSLGNDQVRASLADHVLAAIVRLASADVDSTTRTARAGRRVAVRLAREFIHARLSEPLRLSELCRHARMKIRALEYGFREVTGLTPIAYIKSLRLNAVRRALRPGASARPRSISEIALDAGFWHLSQFAMDYRLFFGETPTETRRRASQGIAPVPRRANQPRLQQAIFR